MLKTSQNSISYRLSAYGYISLLLSPKVIFVTFYLPLVHTLKLVDKILLSYILISETIIIFLFSVQFVDNFYGTRLCGEDQYWWMQFLSAVEFIKTMEYSN